MLEAVTWPAADNPDILVIRMAIDEKIAGGRVLVLAHTTFDDGGIGQGARSRSGVTC
jgi:hypothetical protein